jgi:uncharacterized protein (DUF608 family)
VTTIEKQETLMIYRNEKIKNISFPLGGIGTGCIGLAGNGGLVDWEIFNRQNKNTFNGYSHFAIKVRTKEGSLVKVLQGELPPYRTWKSLDAEVGFLARERDDNPSDSRR